MRTMMDSKQISGDRKEAEKEMIERDVKGATKYEEIDKNGDLGRGRRQRRFKWR